MTSKRDPSKSNGESSLTKPCPPFELRPMEKDIAGMPPNFCIPVDSSMGRQNKKVPIPDYGTSTSVESGLQMQCSVDELLDTDKNKTTYLQTAMHLIKANMGTGILAMPSAFSNAGLYLGAIMLPIVAMCAAFAIHLLILASERLSSVFGLHSLDYEKIAQEAMNNGPKPLQRYGKAFGRIVQGFIVACQYGICCIYALFVAQNLQKILQEYTSISAPVQIYLLVLYFPMFALNCLGNIKKLAVLSMAGNILQATGLVIICTNIFADLPPISERPGVVSDYTKFPLFLSSAMFAFEGISVVVPIYKAMKTPGQFLSAFGVVNAALTVLTASYVIIGFFGFWKYGEDVVGSITLNLPAAPQYECVRVFFTLSLFISYPLQMFVIREMVEPWVERKFEKRARYYNYLATAILVGITFISAGVIPKLDLLLSLAGAVTSSSIAIIFPPIIHLVLFWDTTHGLRRCWITFRNLIVSLFGILGFIFGAYFSIVEIVNSFSS